MLMMLLISQSSKPYSQINIEVVAMLTRWRYRTQKLLIRHNYRLGCECRGGETIPGSPLTYPKKNVSNLQLQQ